MPTVIQFKHNPARISDLGQGPQPFRLTRLILMELRDLLTKPSQLFLPPIGSPGTGGSGGSGGGGAQLATRQTIQWKANGPFRVDTSVDGAWVPPTSCEISGLYLYRTVPGTSGSTILDLKLNGVSLYTTVANRPTIAFGDTDKLVQCVLPDLKAVPAGGIVTVDIIQAEGGVPQHWSLTAEAA